VLKDSNKETETYTAEVSKTSGRSPGNQGSSPGKYNLNLELFVLKGRRVKSPTFRTTAKEQESIISLQFFACK
jgi:hypothetical protein